jgi:hypothetical protein
MFIGALYSISPALVVRFGLGYTWTEQLAQLRPLTDALKQHNAWPACSTAPHTAGCKAATTLTPPTAHHTYRFQRGRLQLYAGMDNTAGAGVPMLQRVCTALITKLPTCPPQHSEMTLSAPQLALGACASDKQDQAGKTYRPQPAKPCANKRTPEAHTRRNSTCFAECNSLAVQQFGEEWTVWL